MKSKPIVGPGILREIEDDRLPELTHKELIFLENILAGESAAESYRRAKPNHNMTENSIWVAASRLKNNDKVKVWMAAAKEAGAMRASCTVESHLIELDRLKELSIQSGNMGAATRCEELRAKAAGLHIAKDPNLRNQETDMETIEEGLKVFGLAVAQTMARELGYHPSQVPCLSPLIEKVIDQGV